MDQMQNITLFSFARKDIIFASNQNENMPS